MSLSKTLIKSLEVSEEKDIPNNEVETLGII